MQLDILYSDLTELSGLRFALEKQLRRFPEAVSLDRDGNIVRYKNHLVSQSQPTLVLRSDPVEFRRILHDEKEQLRASISDLRAQELDFLRELRPSYGILDQQATSVLCAFENAELLSGASLLIGTNAFLSYLPLLGITDPMMNMKRVRDLDLAFLNPEEFMSEAVFLQDGWASITRVLEGTNLQFQPIEKWRSSCFVSQSGYRIDLATPGERGTQKEIARFSDAVADGIPYLDFLLQSPIPAAILGTSEVIFAEVPMASRFALHKILVSAQRPSSEAKKIRKDLEQSSVLLGALKDDVHIFELEESLKAVQNRAESDGVFRDLFAKGLNQIHRLHPEVSKLLPR